MTIRVAINGFGRIGRTVLRAAMTRGDWPDVEIVAINELSDAESCAYLFEYDSIYGPYPGAVALGDGRIDVDGGAIRLTHAADLSGVDLSDVDVVMECTGRADDSAVARAGLHAGARRVLISGPSAAAELTVVIGANEETLTPRHLVVSNASCTTNALAPLARLLHARWGIESGFMTTIHCYTGSQPTIDAPRGAPSRSRAAALSMVPTTTSAQRLTDTVLPELAGRLRGAAVRVPTPSVSAIDLCVTTATPVTEAAVNDALRDAGGVIGWTERPLVSTDLRARHESVVMALPETAMSGGMLRVFGWYDNEWGFSCRMLDMARRMSDPAARRAP